MRFTRSLLPALLLVAWTASAALITPDSYTLSPAPDSGYPDSGGSELTDGVLAQGVVNIPATDGAPYVAWNGPQLVSITFQFDQTYNFSTVQLGLLRSDFYNYAYLPTTVSIAGQDFSVSEAAIPDATRGFLSFSPAGLSANSITINITPRPSLWLMLDEVRFEGTAVGGSNAVPEPGTAAFLGLPLLLAFIAIRRR